MKQCFDWDVFLSWTGEDLELMQKIKTKLSSHIYIDKRGNERKLRVYSSNENCIGEIIKNLDVNINSSSIVVPIVTKNFNEKDAGWCVDEVFRAKENQSDSEFKQTIIPLLFEAPQNACGLVLNTISGVWKVNADDDSQLDQAIRLLLAKIDTALRYRENELEQFLNIYHEASRILSEPSCYHISERLFGRTEELRSFESFVAGHPVSVLTCGLGIGKTAFIRSFIAEQSSSGADVLIVDAQDKTFLDALLCVEFEQATLPLKYSSEREKRLWVKARLESLENRTFIVFDGLDGDGIANALNFSLSNPNLRIILTSNGYDGEGKYSLPTLGVEALCELFYRIYPVESREETERSVVEMINLVEKHTLTIKIIANLLKSSKGLLTVQSIMNRIKEGTLLDLNQRCFFEIDDRGGVTATIKDALLKLFDLSSLKEDAFKSDLLRFLYFVPKEGIDPNQIRQYMGLEDAEILNELYATGWLVKSEPERYGLHRIVKWIVRTALFEDAIPPDILDKVVRYYEENVRNDLFDRRNSSVEKLRKSDAICEGVEQFEKGDLYATLLMNHSHIQDILGNYDLALHAIDIAERYYSEHLEEHASDYLECKKSRLLLYSMRYRDDEDIIRELSSYIGINSKKKNVLLFRLATDIIDECKKYGFKDGEVLGFCYRVNADLKMLTDMNDDRILFWLKQSYNARSSANSPFIFETFDTYGEYYRRLARESEALTEEERESLYQKAFSFFQKGIEKKREIGREKGIADSSNPFIGTSCKFLGKYYVDRKQFENAYKCFEIAIDIRSRVYGEEHPYVLTGCDLLLNIYRQIFDELTEVAERIDLAKKCLFYSMRCMKIKKRLFSPDDANSLSYRQIAKTAYSDLLSLLKQNGIEMDPREIEMINEACGPLSE